MTSRNLEAILAALEQRGDVRREGKGWKTRCPAPNHEDAHPSFHLYPGGGGKCFSACSRYWSPRELAELLGIQLEDSGSGLTVTELAEAKGLPEDFLRSLGVTDGFTGSGSSRRPCVDISYADELGELQAVRKRLSLDGPSRFIWRRGDKPTLYGLPYLARIRRIGKVVLVEGETDAWTLWHHRITALGVPGASTWKERFRHYLDGLVVYAWREPDDGGDNFKERMLALTDAARPFSELSAEAFSNEARECLTKASTLLNSPDILSQLKSAISATGFRGRHPPRLDELYRHHEPTASGSLEPRLHIPERVREERRRRCFITVLPGELFLSPQSFIAKGAYLQ